MGTCLWKTKPGSSPYITNTHLTGRWLATSLQQNDKLLCCALIRKSMCVLVCITALWIDSQVNMAWECAVAEFISMSTLKASWASLVTPLAFWSYSDIVDWYSFFSFSQKAANNAINGLKKSFIPQIHCVFMSNLSKQKTTSVTTKGSCFSPLYLNNICMLTLCPIERSLAGCSCKRSEHAASRENNGCTQ